MSPPRTHDTAFLGRQQNRPLVSSGLYGECAIEYLGAGLGINCNLIEVSLSQGNIAVEQTCFMGLQASIAVADVIDISESMSRKFSFTSPLAEFTVDEPSQSWTVASAAAYFIAGGSVYLGFDVISFCEDLDEIYGWG